MGRGSVATRVVIAAVAAMMAAVTAACGGGQPTSQQPATTPASTAFPGPSVPSSLPATTVAPARPSAPAPAADRLTLVVEPDQGMAPIYRFLSSPKYTLDMTMYELADTTAEEILANDAGRGVVVRVILDHREEGAANAPAYGYLAAHGVHVVWASSAYEATHEKAAVVDAGHTGQMALIMTMNLTSRYYSTTRDFAVADSQPADVAAIETVFEADYGNQTGGSTPGGADLVWSPGSEPALVELIDGARTRLAVENEEMSNRAIIAALAGAARRGVNVEVTMTASKEWSTAFGELTAAGVHVQVYPDTSSALYIHAKAIVVDGREAFVGSQNFSEASLDYNRELGLITSNPAIASGLQATLSSDAAHASPWAPGPTT